MKTYIENRYLRTWDEVAIEYERRTGEPMSRDGAQQTGLNALRKIREALGDLAPDYGWEEDATCHAQ